MRKYSGAFVIFYRPFVCQIRETESLQFEVDTEFEQVAEAAVDLF